MAYKIKWSPRAASDFEEICEYISSNSELYAVFFARRINAIVKEFPRFPKAGRIVPEYQDINLREKIFSGYRIIYRIKVDYIEVVAICHGARLLLSDPISEIEPLSDG